MAEHPGGRASKSYAAPKLDSQLHVDQLHVGQRRSKDLSSDQPHIDQRSSNGARA